jgi:chromosome partitioning protein
MVLTVFTVFKVFKVFMQTYSIAIQKGGSGKTTTALHLAVDLARRGYRVLAVDLDPQANLTQGLGITDYQTESVYNVLHESKTAADVMQDAHGLKLLPSSLDLAAAEMELVSMYARESRLKNALEKISQDFDFCLIDCPPSVGILTINALAASQKVLMPLQAEFFPVKGAALFTRTIDQVRKAINKELQLAGLILTKYDPRKVMHREVSEMLKGQFKGLVYTSSIRQNIALAEAAASGLPVFDYAPESAGSEDYKALTSEFLHRLKGL